MSANNAIGTGAVVITANADQLQSGLQAAGQKVERWAGQVQQKASASAAATGGSGKGGLISGILGGMKGGLAGVALGAGIGLFGSSVGDLLTSTKELAAVGKQADVLGIAPERFMGLGAAAKKAGIEQDQFSGVLGKLGARTSLAASGNAEFAATFQKLGLNAQQLKGMSLDEQFITVADAINRIPNAGDKAAAAMKLFEEGGLKLLPVFAKGRDGLEEFIAKQQKMGTALDSRQMDAIRRAQEALPKIQASYDGLLNKIVVAAAPVIELVANKLSSAFEAIAPVLDVVASYIDGYFFGMAAVLEEVITAVSDFVGELVGATGVTFDWKDAVQFAGHLGVDVFGTVALAASACWDVIKAGAGAVVGVAGMIVQGFGYVVEAFKEIVSLAKKLPENLRPSWLDGLIEGTEQFERSIKSTGEKMTAWGTKQVMGIGDGVARTAEWVDGLHKKFDEKNRPKPGKGATVADFVQQATEPVKFASAISQGTQEAFKLSAQHLWQGKMDDANTPVEIAKKQLAEQKKTTESVDRLGRIAAGKTGEVV